MMEKWILLVGTLPYGTTAAEGNNATPCMAEHPFAKDQFSPHYNILSLGFRCLGPNCLWLLVRVTIDPVPASNLKA